MTKLKATFRVDDGPAITATGREAQTIGALVHADPKGITGLETFLAGGAVRLGAYIFDLKAVGVPIRSTPEPHDGGNHARYYLARPVELVEVIGSTRIKAGALA